MHVYEVIPGIYKFLHKFLLSKLLVTSENSKMKLVTSVEWLHLSSKNNKTNLKKNTWLVNQEYPVEDGKMATIGDH